MKKTWFEQSKAYKINYFGALKKLYTEIQDDQAKVGTVPECESEKANCKEILDSSEMPNGTK
jgi:hypothetical protein